MPLAQRLFLLFAAGAVGGSIGDFFHKTSGIEGYPQDLTRIPAIGLPFWIPALFGSAGLAIGLCHPWADGLISRALSAPPPHRPGLRSLGRVASGLALLVLLWASSGFLPLATGGAKDAVIASGALAIWWAFDRSAPGLLFGAVTAVLGTTVEILQIQRGVFYYAPEASNLFGAPTWLPWLYFAASVTAGNFGRLLANGLTPAKAAAQDR